ncbi:ABC transporter permease [Paenibacillus sp. YYML68]|uniref:ABC transporter permease n=1 Tax=Paenibacillus sp. YYML68 TaxID=2909250 RepID=UPI0024907F23|nr:ABC transporter permease [Paenibacillus sp. YYML68]
MRSIQLIGTIALHLLRRALGNVSGFLVHIGLPVAAIALIFGFLGPSYEAAPRVLYVNADRGPAGAFVVSELAYIHKTLRFEQVLSRAEAERAVANRRATAALIIPAGLTDELLAGPTDEARERKSAELLELTASDMSAPLRQSLERLDRRLQESAATVIGLGLPAEQWVRWLEEAQKRPIRTLTAAQGEASHDVVGLASGVLIVFMMFTAGLSVQLWTEERRQQTMRRMLAAPVKSWELAAGSLAGCFLLGSLQVWSVLLFSRFVLGFHQEVPLLQHLLVLEALLLPVLGVAATVSAVTRSAENISVIHSLISTPMCMLSGCFWSVSKMPDYLQKLALFIPQRWALDAIARLGSGAALRELGLHFAVLGLFAFVLLSLGSGMLKPSEETSS